MEAKGIPEITPDPVKPDAREKYVWKKSYSFVLIANVIYIIFFYLLMNLFQ